MGYPAMGMASVGLAAGSGVLGAMGSISGGSAQASSDRYQAAVAMRNAALATQQADVAQSQGTFQAQPYFQQTSQRLAQARAAEGANGIDINSGSAVADQASIARTGALNTNAVAYDADVRANSYRNQTANDDTQAGLDRVAARQAVDAGWMGAGTSILGAASSVASKWSTFQTTGVPGFGNASGSMISLPASGS